MMVPGCGKRWRELKTWCLKICVGKLIMGVVYVSGAKCQPWVPGIEDSIPKLKQGTVLPRHTNRVADLFVSDTGQWNDVVIR